MICPVKDSFANSEPDAHHDKLHELLKIYPHVMPLNSSVVAFAGLFAPKGTHEQSPCQPANTHHNRLMRARFLDGLRSEFAQTECDQ